VEGYCRAVQWVASHELDREQFLEIAKDMTPTVTLKVDVDLNGVP
jgi:hypothetical protein